MILKRKKKILLILNPFFGLQLKAIKAQEKSGAN